MAQIVEPLRAVRVVDEPGAYAPLKEFSSGPGAHPWERHVDNVAGRLARGEAIPQALLVLEDAAGALVGVCSYWIDELLAPVYRAPIPQSPYVNMIGVDGRYRGARLADGSRPGDVLLAGVLERMKAKHGACHVFALVAAENVHGHALFARHGFGEISPLKAGRQALRVRPPQAF
jgi:ribosomal protein S18 acetylase RimI-like enzyme